MALRLRRVGAQPWTYEDYRRIPADGRRYEIHEGELWLAPSPNADHQRLAFRLAILLNGFVQEHRLGEVFIAPFDVILSPTNIVQPDVVFVSTARSHIVTAENIQGAPDLAVEVISPGTARVDREEKRGMYERASVPEYWVVDGEAQRVTLYALDPQRGRYGRPRVFEGASVVTSGTIPGLELALAQVWAGAR